MTVDRERTGVLILPILILDLDVFWWLPVNNKSDSWHATNAYMDGDRKKMTPCKKICAIRLIKEIVKPQPERPNAWTGLDLGLRNWTWACQFFKPFLTLSNARSNLELFVFFLRKPKVYQVNPIDNYLVWIEIVARICVTHSSSVVSSVCSPGEGRAGVTRRASYTWPGREWADQPATPTLFYSKSFIASSYSHMAPGLWLI